MKRKQKKGLSFRKGWSAAIKMISCARKGEEDESGERQNVPSGFLDPSFNNKDQFHTTPNTDRDPWKFDLILDYIPYCFHFMPCAAPD